MRGAGVRSYLMQKQQQHKQSFKNRKIIPIKTLELIEEFTLTEAIVFHKKFRPFLNQMDISDLINILGFEKSKNKPIRYFSSGMKQRLKFTLELLELEEPC